MQSVISERAKIREMDADEIEEYFYQIASVADMGYHKQDILALEQLYLQYQQITGKKLF